MNSPYHQGASTYHIMPLEGCGVSPPLANILLSLNTFLMDRAFLISSTYDLSLAVEFFVEELIGQLGIGFAAGALHHLPDKEAQ